ncbi:MAG: PKD domain-containing protein, partial [Thermoplasmata archaeon]|nr:PKD domain-containing protein [Thermoplasmata archaeon]
MGYGSDRISLKYSWVFGDGINDNDLWTSNPTVQYKYSFQGIYSVVLNVIDDDNFTDTETLQISVLNKHPIADAGKDILTFEDATIIFNGSNSQDTLSDFEFLNYTWDFGNDIVKYGKITTHYYSQKGEYIAELKVTDDDGEFSITQINISIENLPPIADFGLEYNTLTVSKYEHIIFNGSKSTDTISDLPFL